MDAIYIAATGMKAGQEQVDLISNNLSNINTPAFKRAYANFVEVVSQGHSEAATIGAGARLGETEHEFSAGDLKPTGGMLDIAINGLGFLEVSLPGGEYAYTRNGRLVVDDDGYLATQQGYRLASNIFIPADTQEIRIREDGVVMTRLADEAGFVQAGQIELANFLSPQQLEAMGNGVYGQHGDRLPVYYGNPGAEGMGEIRQGVLEAANVELVNELLNMMMAQRAYQANSQVVRQADQMMQITNSLADG